jgi:hypothetical protein
MRGQSIFLKDHAKTSVEVGREDRVSKFLAQRGAGSTRGGRLIFALDATASRAPTWAMALSLTGDMIGEAARVGALSLQLVYFRGGLDAARECVASAWTSDSARFAQLMSRVECRTGHTQISRVLAHAKRETSQERVGAVVLGKVPPVEETPEVHRRNSIGLKTRRRFCILLGGYQVNRERHGGAGWSSGAERMRPK